VDQTGRRPKYDPARRSSEAPSDPNEFAAAVGECIRRARLDHRWTQAELADRAGLSANYVARLERGELGPSLFVAFRLAEALETHVEALISGGPQPRRTGKRRIAH
jgi:transcriptional regulator with XRE-family HTH domain